MALCFLPVQLQLPLTGASTADQCGHLDLRSLPPSASYRQRDLVWATKKGKPSVETVNFGRLLLPSWSHTVCQRNTGACSECTGLRGGEKGQQMGCTMEMLRENRGCSKAPSAFKSGESGWP